MEDAQSLFKQEEQHDVNMDPGEEPISDNCTVKEEENESSRREDYDEEDVNSSHEGQRPDEDCAASMHSVKEADAHSLLEEEEGVGDISES